MVDKDRSNRLTQLTPCQPERGSLKFRHEVTRIGPVELTPLYSRTRVLGEIPGQPLKGLTKAHPPAQLLEPTNSRRLRGLCIHTDQDVTGPKDIDHLALDAAAPVIEPQEVKATGTLDWADPLTWLQSLDRLEKEGRQAI